MGFVRCILIGMALAQTILAQDTTGITGTWRGRSACEQKESACKDETVVYRVTPVKDRPGSYTVDADRIVDGKALNMGMLEFRYLEQEHALICEYPQGVWRFSVGKEKMDGTLTRRDGSIFRRVTLAKDK